MLRWLSELEKSLDVEKMSIVGSGQFQITDGAPPFRPQLVQGKL